MNKSDVRIGARVRMNIDLVSVPEGTEGTIIKEGKTHIRVAWDRTALFPPDHMRDESRERDGRLYDDFSYFEELNYLDLLPCQETKNATTATSSSFE